MRGDVVTVERVIACEPKVIFDLLACPAKHTLIDGSGSVKDAKDGAPTRLSLGSKFGMSMKIGIAYSMVSTVIEFEDDRRIAWQSRPPGLPGFVAGGRIWRYVLEPVPGGTRVRESWDISQDHQRLLLRFGPTPKRTQDAMAATLDRIAALVEPKA